MKHTKNNECYVPGCHGLTNGGFLCEEHFVPGFTVLDQGRRVVVSMWFAKDRHGEPVVAVVNSAVVGHVFGGREGVETDLLVNGYTDIRLLQTPAQVEAVRPARFIPYGVIRSAQGTDGEVQ